MDTVLTILGLAVLILVVVWIGRRIAAHARRALDADLVQLALEEARAEAVKLGWDEINVEALDAKRGFRRHVERLSRPDIPFKEVAQLAQSASAGVAALGLSAIARRDDVPEKWTDDAIKSLSSSDWWVQAFVYRALVEQAKKPVIGPVLAKLSDETDTDSLARFIQQRRERGEEVGVDTFRGSVSPGLVEPIELFINRYETYLGDDFRGHFEEWRRTAVDLEFLTHIGRILERPYDDPPAYVAGRRDELVEVIVDALEQQPRRSVLLVGSTASGRPRCSALRWNDCRLSSCPSRRPRPRSTPGRCRRRARRADPRARGATRGPSGRLDPAGLQRGALRGPALAEPDRDARRDAPAHRTPGDDGRRRDRPAELREAPRRAAARRRGLRGRPGPAARRAEHRGRRRAAARLAGVAGDPPRGVRAGAAVPPRARSARQPPAPRPATAADVEEEGRHEFETSDVLATLASSSGLPLAMLDPSAPLELADVRAFFEGGSSLSRRPSMRSSSGSR